MDINGLMRTKVKKITLVLIGLMALGIYYSWPSSVIPDWVVVDKVVVIKSKRKLILEMKGQTIKTYRVSLGRDPEGDKVRQGDNRTPEGLYRISGRNPGSRYHRSLRISYPSARDRAEAGKLGVDPGGDIMIHGLPNGLGWLGRFHLFYDWTAGCIAVTDRDIDEIWNVVRDGTPIEIRP